MDFLYLLFTVTAVAILIYSVDDIFLDVQYWLIMARRMVYRRKWSPLTLEKLNNNPEKRVALMVPCWQESQVVAQMLGNTLGTLLYTNYDVFVGVYPNDGATRASLASVIAENPRIHEVVGNKSGPTTKADNLNTIYAGIRDLEQRTGVRYEIFLMHDAEDVIHPLSFKLYNYLLPKVDMVQIPVFPLETRLSWFTHWSYADEFAESHTKDMISREWMGGFVPSAGVGTAFSRPAFDLLDAATGGALFNTETLTEDYAFSLLLRRHKLRGIFVHQAVTRLASRPKWYLFGPPVAREVKEWVATRALFPVRYADAIRQKSRWILGISMQEWKATGWSGDVATRLNLYRDRKSPVGHLMVLAAYVILGYWLLSHGAVWVTGQHVFPPLRPLDETITLLVLIMMSHRLIQRVVAVWRIYGPQPALASIPRAFYLNVLNIHASLRAATLFLRAERKNEPVAWAKTTNRFPTSEQLQIFRRQMGDFMVENSFITRAQLGEALEKQRDGGLRLGKILIEEGMITPDQLLTGLGKLFAMEVALPERVAHSRGEWEKLPKEWRIELADLNAVPVYVSADAYTVAIDDPANSERLEAVKKVLVGRPVRFVLASEEIVQRQAAELKNFQEL